MPIPFAPLLGFALGVAFAWTARRELVRHDGAVWATRAFAMATLFGLLVLAPAAGYFAAFHGDWAYLYLVAWRRVPSALDLALVLVSAACVPVGFMAAAPWSRARRMPHIAILGGVPAGIVAIATLAFARRIATSATFAQFHGRFGGESILDSTLGRGVLLMALVVGLGVVAFVRDARRDAD